MIFLIVGTDRTEVAIAGEEEGSRRMATDCPRCGKSNQCGLAAGKSTCWCFTLPASGLAWDPDATCLCLNCLQAVIDQKKTCSTPPAGPAVVQIDLASGDC